MQQNQITSIIDNCSIKEAFKKIFVLYDPNRAKNRRSKVLDISYCFTWDENDYRLFDITKNRNLNGSILLTRYDIILYETNSNENFLIDVIEKSKIFSSILNIGGVIIVKVKDFQLKNKNLSGHFDVLTIFKSNGFSLINQIIYKHNFDKESNFINDIKTIHSNFLIFKKQIP